MCYVFNTSLIVLRIWELSSFGSRLIGLSIEFVKGAAFAVATILLGAAQRSVLDMFNCAQVSKGRKSPDSTK